MRKKACCHGDGYHKSITSYTTISLLPTVFANTQPTSKVNSHSKHECSSLKAICVVSICRVWMSLQFTCQGLPRSRPRVNWCKLSTHPLLRCKNSRSSVGKSIWPGFRTTQFLFFFNNPAVECLPWVTTSMKKLKTTNKTRKTHLTGCWGALFEASKTKSFSGSPPRGEWNVMCSRSSSTERHWNDRQCLREGEIVLARWPHSQAPHEHLRTRLGHWERYVHDHNVCASTKHNCPCSLVMSSLTFPASR